MPIQSLEFLQKEVRPLYRCILRNARSRYGDNCFELVNIDGQDEVVDFVHGKKLEILGKITIDCGREDNGHGGIFYQFFRKTSPVYKGKYEYRWRDGNEPVELSKPLIEGLFFYITRFNLQQEFSDFQRYQEELLGRFQRDDSAPRSNELESVLARQNRFWKPLNFPKEWRDSEWFCFERTDIGICISCISFHAEEERIVVNMRTYYRDDNIGYHFHYKGLASRDQAQEYVIIELFREDVPHTYASFVLRTGVYNEQGQHVSIGHHSYFAFRWAKYLTKQVVLLRREQLPDLDFEPREIRREDAEYDQLIPLLIRRFLSNRDKNRLSMPGKLINRLEGGTYSLKNWFDDYFRGREPDPRLAGTRGAYIIVYENHDEKAREPLVFAQLDIEMLEPELGEEYSNTRLIYRYNKRTWSGRAHWVGSRSLQCRLVAEPEPIKGSLYLLLNLPKCETAEELHNHIKANPVYGIISGYSERRQEAVAFRFGMALTKQLERGGVKNPKLKEIVKELRKNPGMLRG